MATLAWMPQLSAQRPKIYASHRHSQFSQSYRLVSLRSEDKRVAHNDDAAALGLRELEALEASI